MSETMTIDDLRRILVLCAGEDEVADLSGEILDRSFADLGYDSLALLETAAKVQQGFGAVIADDVLIELTTPRLFLREVNKALAGAG